ncbi:MAG: hypothetical protein V3S64_09895 [bacterium]
MAQWELTGQRTLRNIECVWGKQVRKHLLVMPLFHADHKVRGMIGFSSQENPLWYPGTPAGIERRRLTFKDAFYDHPPPWGEVERDLFQGAYYFDSWLAVASWWPQLPDAPSPEGGVNLALATIRSQSIAEVYFEPSLHRLRALGLRESFFRTRRTDVFSLPSFVDSIVPEGAARRGQGGPSQAPGEDVEGGGLLARMFRQAVRDVQQQGREQAEPENSRDSGP